MKFYDADDSENMNDKEEVWVKAKAPLWFEGQQMISEEGIDDK